MGYLLKWRSKRKVKSGSLIHLADDPRDTPLYSVAEAAAYVGVPRSTLRHWIKEPSNGRAIIEIHGRKLSFYNLLEAHVLMVVLKRNAWLRRVRKGIDTLRERAPQLPHPLLSRELRTASGYRDLFVKTVTGEIENVSQSGQLEFRDLLSRHLKRIDFDQHGPFRLRPYKYQHVAIDHRVSGGRPVVLGTRISVSLLARRRRAGETAEAIARDYQISVADVKEALRYVA
jgi:uncharacterized protein (DUF433 family)